MTTTTPAPRVLSLDEICKRVDRHADDWLRGRDIAKDELLETSMLEHGLSIADVVAECQKRDRRGS